MAQVKHGEFCMFWMPSKERSAGVPWTEAYINDAYKIEAEGDAQAPDAYTGFSSVHPVMSRFRTANAAPYSEESKKPDTGFSGLRLEIRLLLRETTLRTEGNEKVAIKSRVVKRLGRWFSEPNHLRGAFREGRIGIRIDTRPEYNLVPTIDSGYKLTHFEVMHELKFDPTPTIFLILEHSGKPTALNIEGGARIALAPP